MSLVDYLNATPTLPEAAVKPSPVTDALAAQTPQVAPVDVPQPVTDETPAVQASESSAPPTPDPAAQQAGATFANALTGEPEPAQPAKSVDASTQTATATSPDGALISRMRGEAFADLTEATQHTDEANKLRIRQSDLDNNSEIDDGVYDLDGDGAVDPPDNIPDEAQMYGAISQIESEYAEEVTRAEMRAQAEALRITEAFNAKQQEYAIELEGLMDTYSQMNVDPTQLWTQGGAGGIAAKLGMMGSAFLDTYHAMKGWKAPSMSRMWETAIEQNIEMQRNLMTQQQHKIGAFREMWNKARALADDDIEATKIVKKLMIDQAMASQIRALSGFKSIKAQQEAFELMAKRQEKLAESKRELAAEKWKYHQFLESNENARLKLELAAAKAEAGNRATGKAGAAGAAHAKAADTPTTAEGAVRAVTDRYPELKGKSVVPAYKATPDGKMTPFGIIVNENDNRDEAKRAQQTLRAYNEIQHAYAKYEKTMNGLKVHLTKNGLTSPGLLAARLRITTPENAELRSLYAQARAAYQIIVAKERHALFGAAVTGLEQEKSDAIFPSDIGNTGALNTMAALLATGDAKSAMLNGDSRIAVKIWMDHAGQALDGFVSNSVFIPSAANGDALQQDLHRALANPALNRAYSATQGIGDQAAGDNEPDFKGQRNAAAAQKEAEKALRYDREKKGPDNTTYEGDTREASEYYGQRVATTPGGTRIRKSYLESAFAAKAVPASQRSSNEQAMVDNLENTLDVAVGAAIRDLKPGDIGGQLAHVYHELGLGSPPKLKTTRPNAAGRKYDPDGRLNIPFTQEEIPVDSAEFGNVKEEARRLLRAAIVAKYGK